MRYSSPDDSESEPSSGMVLWTTNPAATILSCIALSFASTAGILYNELVQVFDCAFRSLPCMVRVVRNGSGNEGIYGGVDSDVWNVPCSDAP